MKLKEWRKSQGLLQTQAVEAVRKLAPTFTQADWSRYESGRQIPKVQRLAAIERLTDGQVTARDFLPDDSESEAV